VDGASTEESGLPCDNQPARRLEDVRDCGDDLAERFLLSSSTFCMQSFDIGYRHGE
jgi:hypothetical protein